MILCNKLNIEIWWKFNFISRDFLFLRPKIYCYWERSSFFCDKNQQNLQSNVKLIFEFFFLLSFCSTITAEVIPSFILLAIQGLKVVTYVYELNGDQVDVSKSEFSKTSWFISILGNLTSTYFLLKLSLGISF